jgi:3-hydroxyacyl-[acyl-carrier-protein] dehydratase
MTVCALTVAADHPSFEGHFPGAPVLPGVVLLDEAIHALETVAGGEPRRWRVGAVKFLRAVGPGEPLTLAREPLAGGTVRFTILSGEQTVATGTLSPA